VERANLYASTLSYLRGPGVTAEVLAALPLVVVAVSVYYLFGATRGSNTSIFRTGALVSALGALAFWLFWTYLGLGLMLGDLAHLPRSLAIQYSMRARMARRYCSWLVSLLCLR
jgi:hypothetical protein